MAGGPSRLSSYRPNPINTTTTRRIPVVVVLKGKQHNDEGGKVSLFVIVINASVENQGKKLGVP
jgi:hypothetical protein